MDPPPGVGRPRDAWWVWRVGVWRLENVAVHIPLQAHILHQTVAPLRVRLDAQASRCLMLNSQQMCATARSRGRDASTLSQRGQHHVERGLVVRR
jgi:hypothetical protein